VLSAVGATTAGKLEVITVRGLDVTSFHFLLPFYSLCPVIICPPRISVALPVPIPMIPLNPEASPVERLRS